MAPRRGHRVWLPAATYVLSLMALALLLGRPRPPAAVPALAAIPGSRGAAGSGAAVPAPHLPSVFWQGVLRSALPQIAGQPGVGGLDGLVRQFVGQAPYALLRAALPGLAAVPADPPAAGGPAGLPAHPAAVRAPAVPALAPSAARAARAATRRPAAPKRAAPQPSHSGVTVCGQQPEVLVYQTHSEESFVPALAPHSLPGSAFTEDPSKSVVRVGGELASALCKSGVSVVHLSTGFDMEGRIGAFTRSLQAEQSAMKRWPSLRVLIDVHRDEAPRAATTAVVDGLPTARVLIVVGNDATLPDPGWRQNAAWAVQVYRAMNAAYPGLARASENRPYFASGGRFNQQLSPAALLFEIGGAENTMAEELRGAKLLGRTLAGLIQAGEYPH